MKVCVLTDQRGTRGLVAWSRYSLQSTQVNSISIVDDSNRSSCLCVRSIIFLILYDYSEHKKRYSIDRWSKEMTNTAAVYRKVSALFMKNS